jgi:penicillin-binding protein 1A
LDTVGTKNITESTKILDRNGFVLYTIHGGTNRTNIELSDVPAYLPNAFIAIEDVQFYHHFGFNPVTMIL